MIASTSAQVLSEETEAISRTEAFSRAYARWLKALAQLEVPDSEDDEFMKGTFTEERAALRELFLAPAACSEIVWAKLAAFETDLVKERIVGEARDSVLLLGLGAIKADLMNLGIRGEFIWPTLAIQRPLTAFAAPTSTWSQTFATYPTWPRSLGLYSKTQ
jgi:hypothetical protein